MMALKIAQAVALGCLTALSCSPAGAREARAMAAAASNGPWRDPAFFPISVWYQNANETGHSGPYATLAAAAAAARINIFLAQGSNWPEGYGTDWGELEAIKANGLYLIGGTNTPYNENTSNRSVASVLALASSIGAQSNLIGYNAGDEPQCAAGSGVIAMSAVPSVIAGIQSYDPTRMVALNQTDWMIQPQWQHPPANCLQLEQTALQATAVASFDVYPVTSPWGNSAGGYLGVTGTDYAHVSNDAMWVQGLSVQAMRHFATPNQPLWAFIEAGGDNFGLSEVANTMPASVVAGSNTMTATGPQRFTGTWLGMAVSGGGVASGTTIVGVTDPTHAVLSAAATGAGSSVTIGSGQLGDCSASANLCVVNGNEYRPTQAQVSGEVWMSIINGATGIEYFCHDSTSYSFCLGDSGAGGQAATTALNNLASVDRGVSVFAPILNAPTTGMCSMQNFDYGTQTPSTAASCSDGVVTMATTTVPGAVLVKSYRGSTYLLAQPQRRGVGQFTFTLAGLAGKTATILFDNNGRYDHAHLSSGTKFVLDGSGRFSDVLGANHDDYQVKIYRIN